MPYNRNTTPPNRKRNKVPTYYVKVQVNYDGEIVADSEEQAEEMAWSAYYGDDAVLEYSSVESIDVEELEEDEDDEDEDGDDD